MSHPIALLLAAPFVIAPLVTVLRGQRSRSTNEVTPAAGDDAPAVSLVIPARNEARNIARCVESACTADYPHLEIIVVDDHSTDDTSAIVRGIADRDPRVRVVVPDALPDGWFGKQWACAAAARAAGGEILGFMDADTWQAPDLVPRIVNTMRSRGSDLLTVAGTQEMGSFWERLLQPQVFAVLLTRYGGTEVVNESRRPVNKIANGQCLFVRRDAYDEVGGHGAVRDKVAEDLALAQLFFVSARRTTMVLGLEQLRTRMYSSLRELIAGWGKNIYAGGRDAMPLGVVGRALFPPLLFVPSLTGVVPAVILLLGAFGVLSGGVIAWAAIVFSVNLLWWACVYLFLDLSPAYALLHPLGALVLLYISLLAVLRGNQVHWKGRDYRAA